MSAKAMEVFKNMTQDEQLDFIMRKAAETKEELYNQACMQTDDYTSCWDDVREMESLMSSLSGSAVSSNQASVAAEVA